MEMYNESFNDLVGGLYDAVIDPRLWTPAIETIRTRFGFAIAILGVLRMPAEEIMISVSCNVADEYYRRIGDYAGDISEMWGGIAGMSRFPMEEPIIHTAAMPPERYLHNPYYVEWCKPQGLTDQAVLLLGNDSTMVATLGLGRHESAPRIGEAELQGLRILAPHLRRAVTISRLLDRSMNEASTFEAALAAMSAGAVIVDADMAILHANTAANEMLRVADPIRSLGGRLELRVELVPGQLEEAVRAAAGRETELRRRGIGIPTRRRDGLPLIVHIMPLQQRSIRPGTGPRAVAAVFIAESGAAAALPIDAISMLFELTPAEARIFELAVAGHSTREISDELAVASTTVKTHLASLYGKTGRHRRSDLIKLAEDMGARLGGA